MIFNFELIYSRVVSHGALCAIDLESVSNRSVSQFAATKTLHVSLIIEEFLFKFWFKISASDIKLCCFVCVCACCVYMSA